MRKATPPPGLFQGKNIMTPEILGYYRLREGYAELSAGRGLEHQPIFGVTVQPDSNTRSRLFQSQESALSYIQLLS